MRIDESSGSFNIRFTADDIRVATHKSLPYDECMDIAYAIETRFDECFRETVREIIADKLAVEANGGKKYEIRWCWNGDTRQIAFTDYFGTKQEWHNVIWNQPYDIIDETDTICYIDYGDNDE